MECPYNRDMLIKDYGMFCQSVDQCLDQLYDSSLDDATRDLLEKRVKVTFMMTDFSLSALEKYDDDDFLSEARNGVDERRMKWGHYRSSTFSAPPEVINKAYDDAWKELEDSTSL